ncbi:hypothetical protein [uncultured Bosea sp.]|uniref:hypothetical protein n=1 Tax=uncultured Bosea sp. TaxID=211457 RepID=UPI0025EC329A|nr:hypothetical protein [uncultured Bosea sp.]
MGHRDLLLEARSRLEEYLGLQIDRHTDTYLPPDHLRGAGKSAERYMHYRKTVDPDLAALIDKIKEATAVGQSIEIVPVKSDAAQGPPRAA